MLDDVLKSDQQFLFYVSKTRLTEKATLCEESESGGVKLQKFDKLQIRQTFTPI